jgi:hypothetical protein
MPASAAEPAPAPAAPAAAGAAVEPSAESLVFEDVRLEDPFSPDKAAVRLGDVLARGPTVFLFLRHYA